MLSRSIAVIVSLQVIAVTAVAAQAPQPFPRPGQTKPNPGTKPPAPTPPVSSPAQPRIATPSEGPSADSLGVPLYPNAQFITSYDAGRGQRFYLYGVSAPYSEMVLYYRNTLKQRGTELFESPPTYQFETGRYREESMAFPPSVTIKDYTWGGSAGYANPKQGAEPQRFPTIIQIVPAPPGSPQ